MNRKVRRNQTSYGSWIAAIIFVLAVVAAGVYLVQKAMHPNTPASAPTTTESAPPPSAPASAASTIQHPIVQASTGPASASTAALPALADSDASVREGLSALVNGSDLSSLLVPSQIISRAVATIDALPRQSFGSTNILPLRTPKGAMQTGQGDGGVTVIAAANADRYNPYMAVLEQVDPHALVAWYKRNYPLFQQAYRELGYPHGYFNDRLIVAIDDMLAAPELHAQFAVTRTGVHYVFVDPRLQSLSNGQKLMLRLGSANEQQFKAKLRMIRELLTGGQVAH